MAEKHFYEQKKYTEEYLLPYFQSGIRDFHKLKVLEVGCAEGGLMEVLMKIGMDVTGLEINPERVRIALSKNPALKIELGDITDQAIPERFGCKFDMIIIREVVEHIKNKKDLFDNLDSLLKPEGYLFVSFPPKYSPFAGHQQIAKSFLKMIPYLHLLPVQIIKLVANLLGEEPGYADEIKLHFSTGQTIKDFETRCASKNFIPLKKEHFIFRPIYVYRFGLPKLKIPGIPVLKEFFTFGYETLLKKKPF